jgi:tetratricopeptide (TPR) repeat protein
LVVVLRLSHAVSGGRQWVQAELDEAGVRQTATAEFDFAVDPVDAEGIRWYLEDFLEYPVDPAPVIAARVEQRLTQIGSELFERIFGTRDAQRLWDRAQQRLEQVRVEVAGDPTQGAGLPWELLRDPVTDVAVALRAASFVRIHSQPARPVQLPELSSGDHLRVLLVICRPAGREDVPFRSVASHLVRSDAQTALPGLELDVLRPPTFGQLSRVLHAAAARGQPYHVVHFDGHGIYIELTSPNNHNGGPVEVSAHRYATVAPPRPGQHGYLVFEKPSETSNQELVDGPTLGALLAQTGVPVLVLNACRSAYAEAPTQPVTTGTNPDNASGETQAEVAPAMESMDVHARVRAYGSLAAEVADAGVPGVVAMHYNVYVVTAAQFVAELYGGLLAGRSLGAAVSAARRHLAANPRRQIAFEAYPLQDWPVPMVFETAPLTLFTTITGDQSPVIYLAPPEQSTSQNDTDPHSDAVTGKASAGVDSFATMLPRRPHVGFHGRDETLLALDRAFDNHPVVLLHAFAGSGKTSTAAEFARWYQATGGLDNDHGQPGPVLFTSFEHHRPLSHLLTQFGDAFQPLWAANNITWHTRTPTEQRGLALQVVQQIPTLWIWDNVEPITGFPAGAPTPWTPSEQQELSEFLRDLADTRAKVLLTSRRDERAWLGELPDRVQLPPMPMRERFQLTQALAARRGHRLIEVADWRPLLRYSAGNPLTLTVLVGHALRNNLATCKQIEDFVKQLQVGHTTLETDQDKALGRSASLTASLDYGFAHAFTQAESGQLAVLHLFRHIVRADAVVGMGAENNPHRIPQLTGLAHETAISLLDRAADIGLLTPLGGVFYLIHPALPWYFSTLFTHTYGLPDQPSAITAIHAYTHTYAELGRYYLNQYDSGRFQIIPTLVAEEANLLHALELAHTHQLWDDAVGASAGLYHLYKQQGRTSEWARIVDQLTHDLIDPATNQPLPGREEHFGFVTDYRIKMALDARDWPTATHLQQLLTTRIRHDADAVLSVPSDQLDNNALSALRSLAVCIEMLGEILQQQGDPRCVHYYQEAVDLYRRIGAVHEQAVVEVKIGTAHLRVPDLRDLDLAQRHYQCALDLYEEQDYIGRAEAIGQLAGVHYQRFEDARSARSDGPILLRHLDNALRGYYQVLDLFPPDDLPRRAVAHGEIGIIYGTIGDLPTALTHFQQAISYEEASGNTYGAGRHRSNLAALLIMAGRTDEALDWAYAALRDSRQVGPGAADLAARAQWVIESAQQ